jgi:hypothetical protein
VEANLAALVLVVHGVMILAVIAQTVALTLGVVVTNTKRLSIVRYEKLKKRQIMTFIKG